MHPLVARIHPALRTSFIAFVVGRAAFWLGRYLAGRDLASLTYGVGPWAEVNALVDLLNQHVSSVSEAGTYGLIALSELAIFLSAMAVYRIVRREGLPQTADRAVWFWMCAPVMVLMSPGSNVVFGAALALWALEAAGSGRAWLGGLLMAAAAVILPQSVVLFPALGALAFRSSKDELAPWFASLFPTLSVALVILYGVFLGDAPRHIFEAFAVRQSWSLAAFQDAPVQALPLVVGGLLMALWVSNLKRLSAAFALGSLPAIVAFAVAPLGIGGALPLVLAVPVWAHLSLFAQDPEIERPILGLSLLAMILL